MCDRRYFGQERGVKRCTTERKRERWWIEHEKIMTNEMLFNKMSSFRQWSGEHCCHFTEIVTVDEFHVQRHQFLRCSISWILQRHRQALKEPALKADRVPVPKSLLWHQDEGWMGRVHTYIFRSKLLPMNISYQCRYSNLKGKNATMTLPSSCRAACGKSDQPKRTDHLLQLRCFEIEKVICDFTVTLSCRIVFFLAKIWLGQAKALVFPCELFFKGQWMLEVWEKVSTSCQLKAGKGVEYVISLCDFENLTKLCKADNHILKANIWKVQSGG